MSQKTERRVFVKLPQGSGISEIDTLKLLSKAEIDLSSVQFIGDEGIAMSSEDALVVLLVDEQSEDCLLYTSPSPRDQRGSRMPSSA